MHSLWYFEALRTGPLFSDDLDIPLNDGSDIVAIEVGVKSNHQMTRSCVYKSVQLVTEVSDKHTTRYFNLTQVENIKSTRDSVLLMTTFLHLVTLSLVNCTSLIQFNAPEVVSSIDSKVTFC